MKSASIVFLRWVIIMLIKINAPIRENAIVVKNLTSSSLRRLPCNVKNQTKNKVTKATIRATDPVFFSCFTDNPAIISTAEMIIERKMSPK